MNGSRLVAFDTLQMDVGTAASHAEVNGGTYHFPVAAGRTVQLRLVTYGDGSGWANADLQVAPESTGPWTSVATTETANAGSVNIVFTPPVTLDHRCFFQIRLRSMRATDGDTLPSATIAAALLVGDRTLRFPPPSSLVIPTITLGGSPLDTDPVPFWLPGDIVLPANLAFEVLVGNPGDVGVGTVALVIKFGGELGDGGGTPITKTVAVADGFKLITSTPCQSRKLSVYVQSAGLAGQPIDLTARIFFI